tara:strand:- start:6217 stop:7026 length:810 start_codon:yes stop_codon:yes gene_type:complete
MNNSNHKKMILTLMNDIDTKEYMKKKYMELKIQEAKDKKSKNKLFFDWDGLPSDIEDMILKYKYQMELVYIPKFIKENKIKNKEVQKFLHKAFPIPHMAYPSVHNDNIVKIIMNIINKEDLFKGLKYDESKIAIYNKVYNDYIKDKDISLNDLINYKKETDKFHEDKYKLESEKGIQIGDIVFLDRWVSDNKHFERNFFYDVVGQTKTMFKVRKAITEYTFIKIENEYHKREKIHTYFSKDENNKIFNISKNRIRKDYIKHVYKERIYI